METTPQLETRGRRLKARCVLMAGSGREKACFSMHGIPRSLLSFVPNLSVVFKLVVVKPFFEVRGRLRGKQTTVKDVVVMVRSEDLSL